MAEMPDDFDADRVAGIILRGDALPADWLPWITDLDLDGSAIVDLACLAGLARLRSLDLRDTEVSDLRPLTGFWRLEELDLGGTQVTDLGPLANLPNLRCLDLPDTQVSSLAPLAGLRRLEDLDLRKTRVVDLSPLADIASLAGLDLGGTPVTNLKPLARLRRLEELDLRETQVADLTPLAGLASLQWLDLEGTRVTNLKPLASLRELGKINIRGTRIKDLHPIAHVQTVIGAEKARTPVSPEPAPAPVPAATPQPAPHWSSVPTVRRPARDWSRVWRLAAWACSIVLAAALAKVLLAVANDDPATEGQRRLKGLQVAFSFAILPSAIAVAVPWLCAGRWGRRGAWAGARAVIGFFLALYASFFAHLVNAGGDGQSVGFAAFGLVPIWLGVMTFALCTAVLASEAWPSGRPVRPRAGRSQSGKS